MAIALSKIKVQAQTGLMLFYSFLTLMVTNVLVIFIANALFPSQVVLGSASVPFLWAIHHSMFKLSVIGTFIMSFVAYYEWKKSTTFTPKQWMITYFVVNLVGLWGITRFAENLGLGVSSFGVLIILAIAFDFAQAMSMLSLGKVVKMK
ncbi:MAG: hypothetical protein WAV40_03295 [Microgenomates group bacterium]